jgi:hypothetical protein
MLGRPIGQILLFLFFATTTVAYAVFVLFDPSATESFPSRVFNTIAGSADGPRDQELIVSVGELPAGTQDTDRRLAPLEKITGEAKVLGDGTLEILGTKIRLEGLVLPGKLDAALEALSAFARSGDIHCALLTSEVSDIRDGTCWVMSAGHPIDIAAELMLAGLARECVKDSRGRYHVFEQMSAREIAVPPECGGEAVAVSSNAATTSQ